MITCTTPGCDRPAVHTVVGWWCEDCMYEGGTRLLRAVEDPDRAVAELDARDAYDYTAVADAVGGDTDE